ncbi:MAG TPA: hypothetical protein PLT07_09045, partial [Trueperaceae bacterium]|nr:hypothetical protein [Trueperaceae bacterium]
MLALVFAALALVACSSTESLGQHPGPGENPSQTEQAWQVADIGGTGLGSTDIEEEQIVLTSSGDIADAADAFHFTYQQASGDTVIVARLVEHGATTPQIWPKAGLTIRDGLAPDAANITLYAINNDQYRGLIVTARSATGEDTHWLGSRQGATAPLWLRITR